MFKAVCTNLAGFIEARFSLVPRIHILTNKRERQHATLKFVLNHCCNILTEAEVSGKNKTNVLSKTTNRHKEIAMFKIRPCLITRAAMPLPRNDVLRGLRGTSHFPSYSQQEAKIKTSDHIHTWLYNSNRNKYPTNPSRT